MLARKVGSNYYYYLYNGHGDVVQITDENGNIVNSYKYDEWGNTIEKTESFSNPIRYAGEYYDEESGLYYLRARYYDPSIGRFISRDSYEGDISNPLSLNQYEYCMGNPLIYVDPTGHRADEAAFGSRWTYTVKTSTTTKTFSGGSSTSGSTNGNSNTSSKTGNSVIDTIKEVGKSTLDKWVETGDKLVNFQEDHPTLHTAVGIAVIPLTIASGGVNISNAVNKGVTNPLPANGRFSTVMPSGYAEAIAKEGALVGKSEFWITAADDMMGITTRTGAAQRLTLINKDGTLRTNGNAILNFELSNIGGIASPINRENAGFLLGGLTRGGAREWVLPGNTRIINLTITYLND